MENVLESHSEQPVFTEKKRPAFLTTLIILTWVGCLFGLYSSLTAIFGPSPRENLNKMAMQADKIEGSAREMMDSSIEFMSANMEVMERWTLPNSLITLICIALCVYGTLKMWKLQKVGFYFYLAGELIPVIIGLLFIFQIQFPANAGIMGTIMKYSSYLPAFFAALFIWMYAANLKHMK